MEKPTYTDWAAIVIALCALLATFFHGCETRKHNRLSVLPVLMFTKDIYHGDIRQLSVSNNGIGPAIITNMSVYIEGQEVPGGWKNALKILKKYKIDINYNYVKYYDFKFEKDDINALDAGKTLPLIFVEEKYFEDKKFKEQFISAIEKIKMVIKYRSVYDDSDKYEETYWGAKYE